VNLSGPAFRLACPVRVVQSRAGEVSVASRGVVEMRASS
jgi:hypothetical protein